MGPGEGALLDTRDVHADANAETLARVTEALAGLPANQQDEVRRRLAAVVANFGETRQVDPVIHFVESLLMTAQLHRNPAFRKGLSEADEAAQQGEPQHDGNVADLMAAMRERRGH